MKASLIALAIASASATPAFAEEAKDPTIIVTGHAAADAAEARVRQTPGGADVVGYQDYADKTVVSLRDTLAFSPGVYTQPRFGQEVRISIRGSGLSRGFHMRGLTLLQDGIPINLADDNGDFQELEPIFFDHLEVFRGANALRFGSGTLGGAINGVTPSGDTAKGVYARLDGGSYDFLRGLVSAGFGDERASAWGALSADTGDGDREHAKRNSLRGHLNVKLKLSDTVSTRFYGSANHIVQELPGALTEEVALTRPKTGSFAGDQHRNIDSLRLQNRTRFDWGSTSLEAGLFLNSKQLFHPILQVIDQKSDDYGAFARLEHDDQGPFAFTLGGEIRRGSTRARQYVNVNGRRGALTFDADQDARTANLYGELRFRPIEHLTLIAGGIYADGWRARQVNVSTAPAQDGRVSFDEFSPKFGVLFEPVPDVQLYANYSRSAEFPGFGEVFQTVGTTSTFIGAIRPQRAWTAEIGTRGKHGALGWDVSLYRATIKGELLQYNVDVNGGIPASTFNADRTLHQGVEAGLTLDATTWLRLRQTWQYSDFRFRADAAFGDNRLPVVPHHVLRTELRLGGEALHVAPNLEWVPQGAFADYANTHRTGGYALLGVTAAAPLLEGVDVFVDARNLTGKKAVGDISATLRATAASAIYYPAERRAIYGGVRARF
ncbi:TonB-dependent receptor domain-containing protein [Novosphingobium sp. 9U]|uniref:TonB-dependent receptor family protein n=1 Tax=Novosphingobium sp. 9U TaxID=2653158 RepID=UPI0012F24F00|nr:TonB-dependent receptor [Novosphingobium sp. 9U]VWX48701.1 Ligand-gated channel protein [Novosphingobium sp. 9U]